MGIKTVLAAGALGLSLSFGALASAKKAPARPPAQAFHACVYQLTDPDKTCIPVNVKGVNLNPDAELSPASLNKLMTAHLILQHMEATGKTLDDAFVRVTPEDTALGRIGERNGRVVRGGHVLILPEEHTLTYREAIHALTVYSANNVAVAAASAIAPDGTQETFAQMMNAEAAKIGMTGTNFRTASGMPATGQKSTASDMTLLVQFIVDKYGVEQFDALFGQSSATIAGKQVPGHLRLLRNPDVRGGKTGADAEGLNVAGFAQRGELGVAFATLGSPSGPAGNRGVVRDSFTTRMLNLIFGALTPNAKANEAPAQAQASKANPNTKSTAKKEPKPAAKPKPNPKPPAKPTQHRAPANN